MKKFILVFLGLAILLCAAVTACSDRTVTIDGLIPKNITNAELSGHVHAEAEETRALTQTEIEELSAWVSKLSLRHRTFEAGEAPGDYNGGSAYTFSFNDGEASFTWIDIGTKDNKYIRYENEWYEIRNTLESPLNLPS